MLALSRKISKNEEKAYERLKDKYEPVSVPSKIKLENQYREPSSKNNKVLDA
jgi:hypothetical protein